MGTVGVISLYVLLLFRLLRKHGLGDPRLKALFGFVSMGRVSDRASHAQPNTPRLHPHPRSSLRYRYLRFEERFYWWELLGLGVR